MTVDAPAARLLTLTVDGPAGPLEAMLRVPHEARGAAVVAHPHPQYGGTMHTKVVHRTAKLLADRFGLLALRFNFRGVGASAGHFDEGRGETQDLVAAGRVVRGRQPAGPFVVAGFSFGAGCALRAASSLRPDLLVLLGLPVGLAPQTPPADLPASRVLCLHGGEDAVAALAPARALASRAGWRFVEVPGADHFFGGKLDEFEEIAAREIASMLAGTP